MKDYEKIQSENSHFSRGTPFGDRLVDSVHRYSKYVVGDILDVGCGDGLGMSEFKDMGFDVTGIDIAPAKVEQALKYGLNVYQGRQEDLPFENKEVGTVFSSHTLEHSFDFKKALEEYERVARRAIIIVPVEKKKKNPAHTSTITSKDVIKECLKGHKILHEEELDRLENEYVIIVEFKNASTNK
jgi:ubiquinone/menaquinone biosynthesis C-methylase UbiE